MNRNDPPESSPSREAELAAALAAQQDASRRLQDSEERARLALAGASMGVWQHDRVTDTVAFDALAAAHYDVDRARVPLAEVVERIHPDDRAGVQGALRAARDPNEKKPVALEYRVVGRDGRVRWLSVSGRVYFEGSGGQEQWVRGIGTSRDITVRKTALESLRESEARFQVLADTMPQIVWSTRADGYHDYFNERWYEYTGMPRPDEPGGEFDPTGTGQGWNWKDYLHPDDLQPTFDAWHRSLATGDAYHVEYRFKRRDGEYRWFIGRALPLRDDAGRIVRWFGTLTDVHEQTVIARQRDALIEMLREADQQKTDFLAMLSHELRNPLVPMRNAFAVLDREPMTEPARLALGMGHRQLHHLVRLVDDLLELSRVTRGMIELRPEAVIVQQVVHTAAESIATSLDERRQRIRFDLPERPVPLVVDPVRLAQILENLLTNASKYSDPGAGIDVAVRVGADTVDIAVRDEGVGIAPEHLPKLFTLFAQVDTSIDRANGGLGIGLALVRQLVELHGGTVACRSDGLGKGSTFTVRLPREPAGRSGPRPDSRG